VESERRGTWIWYSIRPDALERLARLTGDLRAAGPVPSGALGGRSDPLGGRPIPLGALVEPRG
jgi:hypothetical protein